MAEHIPFGNFIAQVQFPWRYLAPASMVLCMLFTYMADQASENKIIADRDIAICAAVCFAMNCVFVSSYLEEAYHLNYIDTAEIQQYTGFFEGAINGTEYLLPGVDTATLDSKVIGYNTEVFSTAENGTDMTLTIGNTGGDPAVLIPRFNYPNYHISDSDGNLLKTATGSNGAIVFFPKEGYAGEITVRYKEPASWRIAELLSMLGCIFSLLVIFREKLFRTRRIKE